MFGVLLCPTVAVATSRKMNAGRKVLLMASANKYESLAKMDEDTLEAAATAATETAA